MFDQPHIHLWQGLTDREQARLRYGLIWDLDAIAWEQHPAWWSGGYQMLLALKVACGKPPSRPEHAQTYPAPRATAQGTSQMPEKEV
jgi:hypothetical protein